MPFLMIKLIRPVTPCVGVWIETSVECELCVYRQSHPAWVCGLKLLGGIIAAGASLSHPAWVCGLKLKKKLFVIIINGSHPAWVCGLKHLVSVIVAK